MGALLRGSHCWVTKDLFFQFFCAAQSRSYELLRRVTTPRKLSSITLPDFIINQRFRFIDASKAVVNELSQNRHPYNLCREQNAFSLHAKVVSALTLVLYLSLQACATIHILTPLQSHNRNFCSPLQKSLPLQLFQPNQSHVVVLQSRSFKMAYFYAFVQRNYLSTAFLTVTHTFSWLSRNLILKPSTLKILSLLF